MGKEYAYIAYKHEDIDKIKPYLEELNNQGVEVWYDERLVTGREWAEQLAEKLESAKCMILFLTARALTSKYIKREINFAVKKDIPIICAYLEDVHLQGGMLLQLDADQAVYLNRYETVKEATEHLAEGFRTSENQDFRKTYFRKHKEKQNYNVLIAAVLLSILGVFFQYFISANLAEANEVSRTYYVERQLFHLLIGIGVLWISQKVAIKQWYKVTPHFQVVSLLLTLLLLTPFASEQDGINRAIDVGLSSFIPTYLLIIANILCVAYLFQRRKMCFMWLITAMNYFAAIYIGNYLQIGLFIFVITIVIAILNNDQGIKIGARMVGLGLGVYLLKLIVDDTLYASFIYKRIRVWLNPYEDPYGLGFFSCQRLEAIERGGPFGAWGNALYKTYLPEMAIKEDMWTCIVEQFGWIAGVCVVIIYLWLLQEIYKIFKEAVKRRKRFDTVLSIGIFVHMGFAVFYNIASSFNMLLMITDIGYLPFISFGGGNLIHWIEIGLLLSVKKHLRGAE